MPDISDVGCVLCSIDAAEQAVGRVFAAVGDVRQGCRTVRNCLDFDVLTWDKTILDSDFKTKFAPNTLLTSPAAKAESAVDVSITDLETKFQQMRGGFLTPVTCADFAPVAADKTCADKPSFVNVCGTVSKGIRRNENGVLVLYFWAERTLIPKAITPAATTEGNGTGTGGTENQGTGTGG